MKKVFSIIVALALSLGLVTAMPVVADVHSVSVGVHPDTVGLEAEYSIAFNITTTLAIGDHIFVEFPDDTTVPATYVTGVVTVQGASISSGDITRISAREVRIRLPIGIGAPGRVTVVFGQDANIENPTTPGDYTLKVKTSQETAWVTSPKYQIRLSDKSTYEFEYAIPDMIWVDYEVEVDVTLKTRVLGLAGYHSVLIEFWKEGPGNVLFEGWDDDLGVWHAFPNSGYWGPPGGFPVGKDYIATTPFKLTFDTVGLYNIVLVLWEVVDPGDPDTWVELVRDDIAVPVAGVSVEISLSTGWNLISLPIIPSNPAITAVLDEIMEHVKSVWYYDPTIANPNDRWKSYGGPTPTLTTIEDGKAYWIHMSKDADLTVVGVAIVLPEEVPPSYNVVAGWNMIGFKSMGSMKAEDYLQGTKWVRIYEFKDGAWRSLIGSHNMTPNLGYWVAFSEPGIIYP